MNRRGGLYPGLFAAVVIICCIFLSLRVGDSFSAANQRFGVVQAPVLDLGSRMRVVESQLAFSANVSLNMALDAVIPSTSLVGLGCGHGGFTINHSKGEVFCPFLNSEDLVSDVCRPDLLSALNVAFNDDMNLYVSEYNRLDSSVSVPLNSFEVVPFKGYTAVIGTRPVFLSLNDLDGIFVGNASFRPSFKIGGSSVVQDYLGLLSSLESVASQCYDASARDSCFSRLLPRKADFVDVNGSFAFILPTEHSAYCFALHLP